MARTAVALIALAALTSVGQWFWLRVAAHVDMSLMPLQYRGRVRWVQANSTHIQYAAGIVAAGGLCVLTAAAMT